MASNNQLLNKYTFWFFDNSVKEEKPHQLAESKEVTEAFNEKLKPIVTFSTVNEFWEIFQHMKKPNSFEDGIVNYYLQKLIYICLERESNLYGKIQVISQVVILRLNLKNNIQIKFGRILFWHLLHLSVELCNV